MRSPLLTLAVALALAVPASFAQELKERAVFKGHTFRVEQVAFSPDGKLLASGGGDSRGGELKLWDAGSGKEVAALAGYSNSLYALAFSPDGKLLASGDGERRVMLWDVAAGKHLATLKGHAEWVHALGFSPDGSRLASAGDKEVKLWDVKEAKEVSSFRRQACTGSAAFRSDLKALASPNYQEIELWDVAGGKEMGLLSEHRGAVHAVAFSADGRTLASASSRSRYTPGAWVSTGEVKLWDVEARRERATLPGKFGRIYGLALSPDARTLAVLDTLLGGGNRAELKLLDGTTGRELLRHKCSGRSMLAVGFTTDGTLLLVESTDGKALTLWELPRRK